MSDKPALYCEELEHGDLLLVRLARPKANVIDAEMTAALTDVFTRAKSTIDQKAIILSAEGPHFSFGASVEEHRPEKVASMLHTFHRLFRTIAAADVTVIAAVRGQCLGGGLELVSFCHRIIASPDAKFGQPEIKLGVFAPVGSVLLPERVGRGAAEDICLSGRSIASEDARRIGLVDDIAENPEVAAIAYAKEHLLPHSASSLRFAVRALRRGFNDRFFKALADVERLYLEDLMRSHDAPEGIVAFLEKRPAQWRNA